MIAVLVVLRTPSVRESTGTAIMAGGRCDRRRGLGYSDRAVALQPIGPADNRAAFHEIFDGWAAEPAPSHPEASAERWSSYRANLHDGPDPLFSVPPDALSGVTTPGSRVPRMPAPNAPTGRTR